MSKLREEVPIVTGDLETPEEGDLRPYVVFTQLTSGGPYDYAGWVDASDEAMALPILERAAWIVLGELSNFGP